jgi:hypothetical protein
LERRAGRSYLDHFRALRRGRRLHREDFDMLQGLPKGIQFLELEKFEPCIGESFYIECQPAPLEIRLDRVVRLMNGPGFLPRAPFTAIWSTDASISLLLGIYRLRNGGWGPHPIYIEPLHSLGERRQYQSVFF